MINRNKNVCYMINVEYWIGREIFQQKFVSRHQIGTKIFDEFLDNYFKNRSIDYKIYECSQRTISIIDWPKLKREVMEGITESEKCY